MSDQQEKNTLVKKISMFKYEPDEQHMMRMLGTEKYLVKLPTEVKEEEKRVRQ